MSRNVKIKSLSGSHCHLESTARLYSCGRCRIQTHICRSCDRGNVYCGDCAPVARKIAQRAAGRRYQSSDLGRLKHAERQRRYRLRLKQKVTYHSSVRLSIRSLVKVLGEKAENFHDLQPKAKNKPIFCHSCNDVCSSFLRLNPLKLSSSCQPLRTLS